MPEGITIRRVDGKDISRIKEIADSRLKEEYSMELFHFLFENHPQCFLVAENKDHLIGFLIAIPLDGTTLRIMMLAVTNEYRMKGVGSSLLSASLDHAKTRMMTSVVLEVGTDNSQAVDFYVKRGFKVTGILPKYYKDRSDAYLMKRYIVM
jgi:ribosomal-protein-alanine N-acetyltransferase